MGRAAARLMSRDEAAKFLGVSAVAVSRYTARGKLRACAGAPGEQPSYDEEEEVRRFKEEHGRARVRRK